MLLPPSKTYRVLICIREQVNTTRWENGRPVKYPETAIYFSQLAGESGQLFCIEGESAASALENAQIRFFPNSPLRHSLAVEPL